MKVLSLFDGMSCGHQALERAGIDVDTYYASEIDKYAIQVTMANYPDTIQLGSVVDINALELPKIDILLGGSPCQSFSFAGKRKGMSTKDEQEILTLQHYLQLKSEGYEFEGQSYLFWEYMRILEELRVKNPNVLFLLENVEMGAKWEKILSNAIGVRGIHINSALVSAQNRKRIYWINWGMKPSGLFGDMESIIEQPKDRGILLKDILESQVEEKYFLSEKMINGFERHKERHNEKGTGFGYIPKTEIDKGNSLRANAALCPTDNTIIVQNAHNISNQGKNINEKLLKSHSLMARDYKGFGNQGMTRIVVHNTQRRDPNRPSIQKNKNAGGSGHLSRNDGKTYCLDGCNTNAVEIVALTEIRTEQAKQIRRQTGTNPKRQKELVERTDGKIGALLTNQTPDNLVKITNAVEIFNNKRLNETIENNNLVDNCLIDSYNQSIHTDKSITISTRVNASSCTHIYKNSRIRRLTPKECMRLQTVDDNYLMPVSDSQKYKVLGNGWTIEVISYLFKHI